LNDLYDEKNPGNKGSPEKSKLPEIQIPADYENRGPSLQEKSEFEKTLISIQAQNISPKSEKKEEPKPEKPESPKEKKESPVGIISNSSY